MMLMLTDDRGLDARFFRAGRTYELLRLNVRPPPIVDGVLLMADDGKPAWICGIRLANSGVSQATSLNQIVTTKTEEPP